MSARLLTIFFFNDTATTEIYTLSLHDALPICARRHLEETGDPGGRHQGGHGDLHDRDLPRERRVHPGERAPQRRLGQLADRKSTRLNSSHLVISYAVFCLKKKKSGIE